MLEVCCVDFWFLVVLKSSLMTGKLPRMWLVYPLDTWRIGGGRRKYR